MKNGNGKIEVTPRVLVAVVCAALAVGGGGAGVFAAYRTSPASEIRLAVLEERAENHDDDMERVERQLMALNAKMDIIIQRIPR